MGKGWVRDGRGVGEGQALGEDGKKRSLICKPLNPRVSEVPPWSCVKGSSVFLSFRFSPASVLNLVSVVMETCVSVLKIEATVP